MEPVDSTRCWDIRIHAQCRPGWTGCVGGNPDEVIGRRMSVKERLEGKAHADPVERFRAIYDATYPRIMAYTLRRARTRDDALDAVSEIFMVVWRRLDDVPSGQGMVPWVYGVGRRVLANQYRSRERSARLERRLKDNLSAGSSDRPFDLVEEALERLRPGDREILRLVAWDDLDNDQIAAVLETSVTNVAVRLHRARKRLARELGRLGVNHSTRISDQVKSEDGSRTPNGVKGTIPGSGEVETR